MVARVHSGLRRGRGVLVALSLAAALFLMLGFLLNPAAQAGLLAQAAPASSIKLEWNGTTLALTEQNNGANGQVTVGTYAERVCTLEVIVCLTWEDRSGMEISVGGHVCQRIQRGWQQRPGVQVIGQPDQFEHSTHPPGFQGCAYGAGQHGQRQQQQPHVQL